MKAHILKELSILDSKYIGIVRSLEKVDSRFLDISEMVRTSLFREIYIRLMKALLKISDIYKRKRVSWPRKERNRSKNIRENKLSNNCKINLRKTQ